MSNPEQNQLDEKVNEIRLDMPQIAIKEEDEIDENGHCSNRVELEQNNLRLKLENLELKEQLLQKEKFLKQATEELAERRFENLRLKENGRKIRIMANCYKVRYLESQKAINDLKEEHDKMRQDYEQLQIVLSDDINGSDSEQQPTTSKLNYRKRSHDTPDSDSYMRITDDNDQESLVKQSKCMNYDITTDDSAAMPQNAIWNLVGSLQNEQALDANLSNEEQLLSNIREVDLEANGRAFQQDEK